MIAGNKKPANKAGSVCSGCLRQSIGRDKNLRERVQINGPYGIPPALTRARFPYLFLSLANSNSNPQLFFHIFHWLFPLT
jgi:hypothetical protein